MKSETRYYADLLNPVKKLEFLADQLGVIRDLLEEIGDELFTNSLKD